MTAGTAGVVYTVPAQNAFLFKSVVLWNSTATAASVNVILAATSPSVQVYSNVISVAPSTNYSWSGWIALNGGDIIYVYPVGSSINYWISGALLPYATP